MGRARLDLLGDLHCMQRRADAAPGYAAHSVEVIRPVLSDLRQQCAPVPTQSSTRRECRRQRWPPRTRDRGDPSAALESRAQPVAEVDPRCFACCRRLPHFGAADRVVVVQKPCDHRDENRRQSQGRVAAGHRPISYDHAAEQNPGCGSEQHDRGCAKQRRCAQRRNRETGSPSPMTGRRRIHHGVERGRSAVGRPLRLPRLLSPGQGTSRAASRRTRTAKFPKPPVHRDEYVGNGAGVAPARDAPETAGNDQRDDAAFDSRKPGPQSPRRLEEVGVGTPEAPREQQPSAVPGDSSPRRARRKEEQVAEKAAPAARFHQPSQHIHPLIVDQEGKPPDGEEGGAETGEPQHADWIHDRTQNRFQPREQPSQSLYPRAVGVGGDGVSVLMTLATAATWSREGGRTRPICPTHASFMFPLVRLRMRKRFYGA